MGSLVAPFEVVSSWIQISYRETQQFTEVYGFAGSQGAVNLEGVLHRPEGRNASTLMIFMHPASTLQLMPLPRALAAAGFHVLCAGSRYARNDTALIMEKVVLDLGAYIRHAKERLGYKRVVVNGWSGGGSLALFYQAEAEAPAVTQTPSGEALDLKSAALLPADGIIVHAAHISRARLILDCIDPSIVDENDPDRRIQDLDIYDAQHGPRPPFDPAFMREFRKRQRQRVERIDAAVLERLSDLRRRGGKEVERCFITHRTMADPRFLDAKLDPNDRREGWCYLGDPETVNSGPVGLGRFATLRSWLSQWSIAHSQADGIRNAKRVTAPFLAIENSADDAVPADHMSTIYAAAGSQDRTMYVVRGATHYYVGQKDKLDEAVGVVSNWLQDRNFT